MYEHIKSNPPRLLSFIDKCEKRCVAFDNTLEGEESDKQVEELLIEICKNVQKNEGRCYTDEMFQEAEEHIQKIMKEKMKQKEEKRKRELKEIERKLEEKYEEIFKTEKAKITQLQTELNKLNESKKEKDHEVLEMRKNSEGYQRKIEESSGEEREKLQKDVDMLNSKISDMEKDAIKKAGMIKSLEKTKKKTQKLCDDIMKNMLIEKEKAQKRYDEHHVEQIREKVRQEIANKGLMANLLNMALQYGTNCILKYFFSRADKESAGETSAAAAADTTVDHDLDEVVVNH